jgi:hypothetical protein
MYRKSVPPLLAACLVPVLLRPCFPSIAPSRPALFLATIRPWPRSHLAPIPDISLCLLLVFSRPRVGHNRLLGTLRLQHHKRLSEIPLYSALPLPRGARVQRKLRLQRYLVLENCVVRKPRLRWSLASTALSSWLVFFSLTFSSCVFVVIFGQTLNSLDESLKASSKQYAYRFYRVGDNGSPCVRPIYLLAIA